MTGLSKHDCQPEMDVADVCCIFFAFIFDTTFMNISCIYNEKMPVCFCKKIKKNKKNLYLKNK